MKILFVFLFLFLGCGEIDNSCRTQAEMILRCQADEMARTGFFTKNVTVEIRDYCNNLYPTESCW